VETGATLTNQDVTGFSSLTAEQFYAKAFTFGITTVTGTTTSFLVSHDISPSMGPLQHCGCDLLATGTGPRNSKNN
jgi:hypothetical protein